MLSRKLKLFNDEILLKNSDSIEDSFDYKIVDHGYGKNNVKILHITRNGSVHSVKELEINTRLQLYSKKDYIYGDNTDIIATDSQKNTIYILAKKYGITSPEEFGLKLCNHFLSQYKHVKAVSIDIDEYPWNRFGDDNNYNKQHNHAFVFVPDAIRYCSVIQERNISPTVISGIKDLRVLKTTQSSFVNFIDDEYRSLPDTNDRIFSTIVRSSWQYSTIENIDFDKIWKIVKSCILNNFAGDLEKGTPSPSVQYTLYLTEKEILQRIPQIISIEMEMPNKHYFIFDLSKFPKVVENNNQDVFLPVDKPSGIIYAKLNRKDIKSKL